MYQTTHRRAPPPQRARRGEDSSARGRGAGAGAVPEGGLLHLHRQRAAGRGRAGKKGKGGGGLGKTDYNFEWDPKMYDGNDWAGRKPGQPFFMQVQLSGGKLRGGTDAMRRKLLGAGRSGIRRGDRPGQGHAAAVLPARPGAAARLGGVSRCGALHRPACRAR